MGDEQMTQEQKGKTPVLDVQNLTKIYDNGGKGDGNEVLKNVNFTMNEGEFVCILGPSGCGKTCLLYTSPSPRDRTRSRMPSSA